MNLSFTQFCIWQDTSAKLITDGVRIQDMAFAGVNFNPLFGAGEWFFEVFGNNSIWRGHNASSDTGTYVRFTTCGFPANLTPATITVTFGIPPP